MNEDEELPRIEEWWARLSIAGRHAVLEDLHAPLDARVRAEIQRITGRAVPEGTRLSRHEVGFVEVQQQPVD